VVLEGVLAPLLPLALLSLSPPLPPKRRREIERQKALGVVGEGEGEADEGVGEGEEVVGEEVRERQKRERER
jgi:hypothetical protein